MTVPERSTDLAIEGLLGVKSGVRRRLLSRAAEVEEEDEDGRRSVSTSKESLLTSASSIWTRVLRGLRTSGGVAEVDMAGLLIPRRHLNLGRVDKG
jgi:hypothetical protein